jgi:hypothetical protein
MPDMKLSEADKAKYYRQGERRLRDWMPSCRAKALTDGGPDSVSKDSAIAESMWPYIREKNLDALLITPGERGGWHADLVLKDVPKGFANTLGTPTQTPCVSEAEAEKHGKAILIMALWIAHQNRNTPEPKPFDTDAPFSLYGWTIRLPAGVVSQWLEAFPDYKENGPYGTEAHARKRIDQTLEEIAPGVDPNTLDMKAFTVEQNVLLISVLIGASLSGVFRHPPFEPGLPGAEFPK